MGRWEPDAEGRLVQAALELYAESGFDRTTVADIAARAGVTERTFFRYFADKREVLFDRTNALQDGVVAAIAAAPPSASALDAVGSALETAAPALLEPRRDFARQRSAVIAAHPGLQERELLKLASLAAAVAEALRRRGVPEPAASLAAESGVAVFRVGFERWVADTSNGSLDQCVRAAVDELKTLTRS